jgi:hypothetical protein
MNIPGRVGLVIMENDETVPEVKYLKSFEEAALSPMSAYPQHTRIFMQQTEGTCSLAYAVSQTGARGILNDLGINRLTGPFDNMLRGWCAGLEGSSGHLCFGVPRNSSITTDARVLLKAIATYLRQAAIS